jgi:hypothetical protein
MTGKIPTIVRAIDLPHPLLLKTRLRELLKSIRSYCFLRSALSAWCASISFAQWHMAGWCAISRSTEVARQHGNGVADSLPSGSGNLDVQPTRKPLPVARCRTEGLARSRHVTRLGRAQKSRYSFSVNAVRLNRSNQSCYIFWSA